jgi:hypothetical protein
MRTPLVGLVGVFAFALLAGFFAWVSAEPFWLALGHGTRGVATVERCSGSGIEQRCHGEFTAADGSFRSERVALVAVPGQARHAGRSVDAAMVSAAGRIAYAGDRGGLLLRWTLGWAVVLLCGLGTAWATGASRLSRPGARLGAWITSLAAPALLLAGVLAATW